jgi:hypothetical protein
MSRAKKLSAKHIQYLVSLLVLVTLTAAQTQSPERQPPKTKTTQAAESDQKISPKQAEDLFQSVDEILKFASKDTGFPIKQEVKRRLTSRSEVMQYLRKNMAEDKDARRLQRSELVLKKFGLLPRDFDLKTFLVTLLGEQIAGYYDPKTKTVNLLDWLGIEQQRPILAHELTHALQDQSFDLQKWMKSEEADLNDKKDLTAADIAADEAAEVRQAIVEGQAMIVLVDYMLAPMGKSLVNSPEVLALLKQGMIDESTHSAELQNAPMFLRESLVFPYRYGTEFLVKLLQTGGTSKAFAGIFATPPATTRQIMQPQTYLSAENIPPMPVPDLQKLFRAYDRFDVGAIGEFDVSLLIEQYAGEEIARELSQHWRGGYYYAAIPKEHPNSPLGLMYVSRWADGERAAQFAAIYAKALKKRYQHVQEKVNGPAERQLNLAALETLSGRHTWITEEGPVVIEVHGDMVLAVESLDPAVTEELEQALFVTTHAGK